MVSQAFMPMLMARDGTPIPERVTLGVPLELEAIPVYEDGTVGTPSDHATWTLTPVGNGSIKDGVLTLTQEGETSIVASIDGVDSDPVTVWGEPGLIPLSVKVNPAGVGYTLDVTPTLRSDLKRQVKVTDTPANVAYDQSVGPAAGWQALGRTVNGVTGQFVNVADASLIGVNARGYGYAVLPGNGKPVYWGATDTTSPADYTPELVASLQSRLTETPAGEYAYTPGTSGQWLAFLLPDTWDTPRFTVSGFEAPFTDMGTLTIDTTVYRLWTSKNRITMPTTVTVTPTAKENGNGIDHA